MTFWTLLRANTFRKPTRTSLTFLSLAIAFLLFMLLRAIAHAFAGGVSPEGLDRLIVDSRYSMIDNLPVAHVERIRALDEVDSATHITWFPGFYQEPSQTLTIHPVDPESYFEVYSEQITEPAVLDRFMRSRTSAVVSASLASRYGWQAGDVVTIESQTFPKADGDPRWRFELAGTFAYAPGNAETDLLLFHHDYFNEAVIMAARDQVGQITARVMDSQPMDEAIAAIDRLFANSADATLSTHEDEYRRRFARQLGDIGQVTTLILSAVFFSLVLLTANTSLQVFREQIPELAVMKTLGFSNAAVSLLVFGQSLLLCLVGAGAGIVLALLLEPGMNSSLQNMIGRFEMTALSIAQAAGMAALLGISLGAYTAWCSLRLPIIDALSRN